MFCIDWIETYINCSQHIIGFIWFKWDSKWDSIIWLSVFLLGLRSVHHSHDLIIIHKISKDLNWGSAHDQTLYSRQELELILQQIRWDEMRFDESRNACDRTVLSNRSQSIGPQTIQLLRQWSTRHQLSRQCWRIPWEWVPVRQLWVADNETLDWVVPSIHWRTILNYFLLDSKKDLLFVHLLCLYLKWESHAFHLLWNCI